MQKLTYYIVKRLPCALESTILMYVINVYRNVAHQNIDKLDQRESGMQHMFLTSVTVKQFQKFNLLKFQKK